MLGTGKGLCAVLFCRSSANCVFVVYLRGQISQACVNSVLCFFLSTLIGYITIFRDIIVILFSLLFLSLCFALCCFAVLVSLMVCNVCLARVWALWT